MTLARWLCNQCMISISSIPMCHADVFPLCSRSDLALRNCYLTADLTVKVGDYGIGPYRYKVSMNLNFTHFLLREFCNFIIDVRNCIFFHHKYIIHHPRHDPVELFGADTNKYCGNFLNSWSDTDYEW